MLVARAVLLGMLGIGMLAICTTIGCRKESSSQSTETPAAGIAETQPSSPPASSNPAEADDSNGNGSDVNVVMATKPGVEMISNAVGTQACVACHPNRASSFFETAHANSLREVSAESESELNSFLHPASSQRMRVTKQAEQVVHEAWQELPQTRFELPIASEPMELVMGSGTFAKSYLFRDVDSLMQAPLTHYTKRDQYDMSPGYDSANHLGFSRQVTDDCLFCHAGSLSRLKGNRNHSVLNELAIGCERCHGGGAQHVAVAKEQAEQKDSLTNDAHSDVDWSIVHPAQLPRDQLESICAQCHLQGDVQMFTNQKDSWSFEPGNDLAKTRLVYNVGPANQVADSTTFVGHFGQMHASKCYLESDELTCVTCHDPHHAIDEANRVQVHRDHCLNCHDNLDCGEEMTVRQDANQNSCHVCHMPRAGTEVPHVSITNHLIAIPTADRQQESSEARSSKVARTELPNAIALLDRSPEGSWQRELNESTAIAQWLWMGADGSYDTQEVFQKAIQRLRSAIQVAEENENASEHVHVSLIEARTRLGSLVDRLLRLPGTRVSDEERAELANESQELMQTVLDLESDPTPEVQVALESLAGWAAEEERHREAYNLYKRLVKLRRNPADHYNLGLACGKLRRFGEAEQALLEALRIQPTYSLPYASLARLYQSIDPATASNYMQLAQRLQLVQQGDSVSQDSEPSK